MIAPQRNGPNVGDTGSRLGTAAAGLNAVTIERRAEQAKRSFCGDHIRGNLKRRASAFARQVERLQRPVVKSPRMSNIDQ
jgi:hypothetical protein